MSAREDQADARRVLSGDLSAFEGIVRRWQGPVVNLAYRFSRDRARAEEMAQEAFLKAYRGLAGWRQDAVFSTWLFAVAANHFRSSGREAPAMLVALDRVADLVSDGRSADAFLLEQDRDQAVRAAVLSLPWKYRETITLFYFHGMDISAAARSLGIPEGTVKARLARGRDLLRAKLAHGLPDLRLKEAR